MKKYKKVDKRTIRKKSVPTVKPTLQFPDGYSLSSKHKHKTSFKTVRKREYRGTKIRVETTYKITVDGKPLTSHIGVLDDGTVHYHDFPNYSFASAVDMAQKVVDALIEFEEPNDELSDDTDNGHGGHH